MARIFVTVVRPGKQPQMVEVESGSTVEQVFAAMGLPTSEYANWTVQDANGSSLSLSSRINVTTHLICGMSVAGA